jgi:histidinol-phosphate phosphatase family protein
VTGRAILLDKDGTLIEDLPYNVDPDRIRLAPGADRAIRALAAAGYDFAIVTNQSGVARGYFPLEALRAVENRLRAELEARGARLVAFYACPHHPAGVNGFAVDCVCRKPLPGLVRRAAADLGVLPEAAWLIGDTWMDVAAGRAAGCRTIMVGPDRLRLAELPRSGRPDHVALDLAAAARIVLTTDGLPVPTLLQVEAAA